MQRKQTIIITVLVVVVVVIVILGTQLGGGPGEPGATEGGEEAVEVLGEDVFRPENPEALETVQGGTRETIKEGVATPEAGETAGSEDVAVPVGVTPVGSAAIRTFELTGEGARITPSTVIVNENDIITIRLSAVDADYDLSFPDFGVYKKVSQGDTAKIQFQGRPYGEYQFSCNLCSGSFEGKLIVNQK